MWSCGGRPHAGLVFAEDGGASPLPSGKWLRLPRAAGALRAPTPRPARRLGFVGRVGRAIVAAGSTVENRFEARRWH